MQKKIIALAVAGLASSAAFAQSNVTVYGIMDAYFANSTGNNVSASGIGSGGLSTSRIGVKGMEDLGNGMKAVFNLEQSVAADGSSGPFSGGTMRQSNIGLTGGFGTVMVGGMSTLTDAWSAKYQYAGNFSADTLGGLRALASMSVVKAPNAIAYLSPSFSGATVGVARVFSETNSTTAGRTDITQLGVDYGNGPLAATYVWSIQQQANGAATDNAKENFFAISYNAGVVIPMFEYTDLHNAGGGKDKFYELGVVVPVSAAGNIHAGYGWEKEANGDKAKSYILAYSHAMSKRTTAYAGYLRNSNDSGNVAAIAGGGAFASVPAAVGTGVGTIAVGLRHSF